MQSNSSLSLFIDDGHESQVVAISAPKKRNIPSAIVGFMELSQVESPDTSLLAES